MRLSRLFTLAIPVALATGGAAWFLNLGQPTEPRLEYETAVIEKGTIRRIVSTSGPVRALVTVSVGSYLSGPVESVNADFNSEVKPGDVLAKLDRRTFAAKVAEAEANLLAAKAALANQKAALIKAEAVLLNSERTIERQRSLAQKKFASEQSLDNAIRDRDVARAEIAVVKSLIETADAQIVQRQAVLESARVDLERSEIKSPIAGTVISRSVDPGQTVASSFQAPELFKIAQDLSRIRIEAQVNEADVGSIAEGNPVTFSVDAYPDREFEGRVTQIRLAATEINNVVTYTVIIEAKNEDRRLFPGMTANVRIESARRDGVLRVSNDALRFRPRGEIAGSDGGTKGGADRSARTVERLKGELALTDSQAEKLKAEVQAIGAEARADSQGGGFAAARPDPSAFRMKLNMRIEQVIVPTMSEEQRKIYERWKKGRESTRAAALWALDAAGKPERRMARVGLADDQFTEIVGGDVKEGDKLIVRVREAKK
ncbi:MAG: efflux RND transporter periplasmic adaptor subunit [Hyphomicrobium sp.]|nr:efflux RND transporter periplasmic adaptor subunit [Hyphomicrobium sp.]PPD06726.1 MAG: efflux transporter periplasmic adaptor subunit [Hyphomicrobium sp.]